MPEPREYELNIDDIEEFTPQIENEAEQKLTETIRQIPNNQMFVDSKGLKLIKINGQVMLYDNYLAMQKAKEEGTTITDIDFFPQPNDPLANLNKQLQRKDFEKIKWDKARELTAHILEKASQGHFYYDVFFLSADGTQTPYTKLLGKMTIAEIARDIYERSEKFKPDAKYLIKCYCEELKGVNKEFDAQVIKIKKDGKIEHYGEYIDAENNNIEQSPINLPFSLFNTDKSEVSMPVNDPNVQVLIKFFETQQTMQKENSNLQQTMWQRLSEKDQQMFNTIIDRTEKANQQTITMLKDMSQSNLDNALKTTEMFFKGYKEGKDIDKTPAEETMSVVKTIGIALGGMVIAKNLGIDLKNILNLAGLKDILGGLTGGLTETVAPAPATQQQNIVPQNNQNQQIQQNQPVIEENMNKIEKLIKNAIETYGALYIANMNGDEAKTKQLLMKSTAEYWINKAIDMEALDDIASSTPESLFETAKKVTKNNPKIEEFKTDLIAKFTEIVNLAQFKQKEITDIFNADKSEPNAS